MKKIFSLLLVLCLALSLAACGKDKAASGDLGQKPAFSIPTENGTEAPTEITTEPTATPTTEETEPPVERYMEPIAARYWADTVNGYHIIESTKDPYKGQYLCINAEGFVTVALDMDNEKVCTGVYDDAFVTTTDNAVYIRSAVDGKIIFEYATDENTVAFPMTDGMKDGYAMYIVHKSETYNGVSYEIGFVDTKGKWVLEMTSDSPLFDYFDDGGTLDDFEKMRYCGEGLMILNGINYGYFLYNISKDQIYELAYHDDPGYNTYFPGASIVFENGYGLNDQWSTIYIVYTDGTSVPLHFQSDKYGADFSDPGRHHGEGTYLDLQTKTLYGIGCKSEYTLEDSCVYVSTHTGEIMYEHTNTRLEHTNGFYPNGTAPVILGNQEGTKYFTLLDTKGQFLYEPIKLTYQYVFDISTGFMAYIDGSLTYGMQFIDSNGQTVHTAEGISNTAEMRNGIIKYRLNYEDVFWEIK